MTRRRTIRTAVAAVLGLTVIGAGAAAVGVEWSDNAGQSEPTGPANTVHVVRRTLTDAANVTAEIVYGDRTTLAARATGTVTWLPVPGALVQRGEILWRVDEVSTVLLYGSLPMYRSLESGVEGGDVEQFETNLRELGFTGFTVDRQFNADTQNAVRRWQRQLGVQATGVVDQARVTYSGAAVRIDEVLESIGSSAPADLLAVTGTTRVVRATVPSATAGWATVDAAVMVLPVGGAAVAGIVAAVTPASSTDGDANPSVTVTVAVADQASLTARDAVIRYVIEERRDVLTVPVSALLALPEGGYGLELVDGRLVPVEVGLFADGQVEIRGASVSEGLEVGMPA